MRDDTRHDIQDDPRDAAWVGGSDAAALVPRFGELVRHRRQAMGFSQRQFAFATSYSATHLSKVETDKQSPTLDLARACDRVLGAGGLLAEPTLTRIAEEAVRATSLARLDRHPAPPRGDNGSGEHLAEPRVAAVGVPDESDGSDAVAEPAREAPAQLPVRPAGVVGREGSHQELDEAVGGGGPALVVVSGPPGVGKTSLVLTWAHGRAAEFPDGVLFADLRGHSPSAAPVDPGEVCSQFLIARGVAAAAIPEDAAARAALWRTVCAPLRLLVVLDNVASAEQVRPLLPAAVGSATVMSSRDRLSGLIRQEGAQRVTLDPLAPEDAAQVLVTAIGQHRADPASNQIATLAVRCGYLPLALRLAGDWVATFPDEDLSELVAELDAESSRMDLLSPPDDPASTVRVVFDLSYRQLDADHARAWRRLGWHPPTSRISLGAIAALADTDEATAARWCARLAAGHLLIPVGRRHYRVHDLLRIYAGERADAEDDREARTEAVRRLCDHYLSTAEAAAGWLRSGSQTHESWVDSARLSVPAPVFGSRSAALRWCDQEVPALAAIAEFARRHQHEAAEQLPLVLADVLAMRHPDLWLRLHQIAHRSAGDSDPALAAYLGLGMGAACRARRKLRDAIGHLEAAAGAFGAHGDATGRARALAEIGRCYADRGSIGRAGRHFTDAAAVFAEIGDELGEADMLVELGDVEREAGGFDAAAEMFHRAHTACVAHDAVAAQARCLRRWAALYRDLDQPKDAEQTLRAALQAADTAGDLAERARSLRDLGQVLVRTAPEAAKDAWNSAAELFEGLQDHDAADEARSYAHTKQPDADTAQPDTRTARGVAVLPNRPMVSPNRPTLPPAEYTPHRDAHDDSATGDPPAGEPGGEPRPAPLEGPPRREPGSQRPAGPAEPAQHPGGHDDEHR